MADTYLVACTPPNGSPQQYTTWLNNVSNHGWELVEVACNPGTNVVMNYFRATSHSANPAAVHALRFEDVS